MEIFLLLFLACLFDYSHYYSAATFASDIDFDPSSFLISSSLREGEREGGEEDAYGDDPFEPQPGGHFPSASAAAPTWGPTPPPNIN
jgi:hypothetical protein